MKLNKSEKQFIKNNQDFLKKMFERQIEDYKESIFNMGAGEERDRTILLVQELRAWLKAVKIITQKRTKDDNPNFI